MKLFKLLSISVLAAGLLNSCLVDDDIPANIETTPYIVGFDQASATNSYFEDIGPVEVAYPVSLKGSPTGSNNTEDIVVSYSVDPTSTAIEGQEYDFVSNTGSLTIPANSNFALLPIYVNTGNLDPDAPTNLKINIATSTDNTTVSAQYQQLTITFVGCQSVLGGNYAVTGLRLPDNASFSMGTEPLTEVAANTFHTLTVGHWAAGSNSPDHGFDFVDVCGQLTILPDQLLMNAFSNEWGGIQHEDELAETGSHGFVDPVTGDFEIVYHIVLSGTDYIYNMTYTKL